MNDVYILIAGFVVFGITFSAMFILAIVSSRERAKNSERDSP